MKRPAGIRSTLLIALIIIAFTITGCGSIPASGTPSEATTVKESANTKTTTAPTAAPQIQTIKVSMDSKHLGKKMNLNVYLPIDYDKNKKYAVLYLYHGYGGDENDWAEDMNLESTAGKLFLSGKVTPFIIVTPDLGNSYAINSEEYGDYEDYLIQDVIGYIDTNYSTIQGREARYIGGLSMGGHAALHLGFKYHDLFSKVGGFSPAVWLMYDPGNYTDIIQWMYPTEELRKDRDPLLLAESCDLTQTMVWLDCGTEDDYKFYEGTEKLYNILKTKGVQAEYHAFPGKHEGAYWSAHLEEYLTFFGSK